jgi:hypothetical protein
MNEPAKALRQLSALGYRFKVEGDNILADYQGPGAPDPAKVRPLLETVKAHKGAVREFLRCHCPKCSSAVFVREQCFLCDWLPQARQAAQAPDPQGETSTCGGCAHFLPSRLNPAQGFGRCGLVNLSNRPGAYPGKAACKHFEAPVGEEPIRLAQ